MQNFNRDDFRRAALPSEAEIMADWPEDIERPAVSVACITYNHQEYVEDALRGFLIQKTDFPFEIVVHDDASTDDTPKILKRYADQYPNLIKLVLQTENQHSQGKRVTRLAIQYCTAEILAICEGDDFWVDDKKLSIQTKIMNANQDAAFIVHPCITLDQEENCQVAYTQGNEVRQFGAQDVLNTAAQFAPTSSYMFKRKVLDVFPAWLDSAPVGDFFIEMYSLKLGVGIYIPNVMSVYRTFSTGSWMDQRRNAKGSGLINYANKMNACFCRMQEDDFFKNLNFNIKKSAIHLELATGYLLNNDPDNFKEHIVKSHLLSPGSSLIQKVFMMLRWFPAMARLLFKCKRQLNLFFKLA